MAVRKKPAKAKSKAPVRTGKSKATRPAAKKSAPAKKPTAGKRVAATKPVAAKQPAAAKKAATAPKKPVPPPRTAIAARAVAAKPALRPARPAAPVMAKALPKPKFSPAKKLAVLPRPPVVPEIIPPPPDVGSDYMNPAQRELYRRLLLDQRNELLAELEHTIHHMQDENVNLPDPNDRASQEADMTLELRSRDRETKLVRKIDEAIARLEAGEYGYCESCGEPIGRGRLEARPTATLCIDCKRLDEIREKQVA
jgi:DnaK suppressor protein